MEFIRYFKKSRRIQILVLLVVLLFGLDLLAYKIKGYTSFKQTTDSLGNAKTYDQAIKTKELKPAEQILEITIQYTQKDKAAFTITNTQKKTGYPSKPLPKGNKYKLEILDSTNASVYSLEFSVPNQIKGPPPLGKEDGQEAKNVELKQTDFVLTTPWFEGANIIRIVDSSNQTLTQSALSKETSVKKEETKPQFKTIRADEFLKKATQLINLRNIFPQAYAETNNGYLDITFVSSGYTDMGKFHYDIDKFVTHLLTYEPYKTRASQILIHYVDNTSDLGCTYSGRLLYCNETLVTQVVNNSGSPYDELVVIVDSPTYGGAGGNMAVTYNGELGPQVFVHEFGHSLGQLDDEYTYDAYIGGEIDNTTRNNCYAGTPPAQDWLGIVAPLDYAPGCSYKNWYRSSPNSIMLTLSAEYFNTVSQKLINSALDFYAGQFVDNSAPVINIINPSSNQTIKGDLQINYVTSDNNGVARVEFWEDDKLHQTIYTGINGSSTIDWKTTRETNGNHTIQLKAYDTRGNLGLSDMRTITINNVVDYTSPTVFINNPSSGAILTDTAWIDAYGNDNVEVAKMQIYIDDKFVFENNGNYISYMLDVPMMINGRHKLTIKAFDWSGRSGQSSVWITTKLIDTTLPYIAITSPYDYSELALGPVWINTTLSDNYGVVKVEFYGDNKLISTTNFAYRPYRAETYWDATNFADNSIHTIYAKAYDGAGNVSKSQVINIRVHDYTAPSQITNLSAASNFGGTSLSWTSPGDDEATGTAKLYEIVYSDSLPITVSNWDQLQKVANPPAPLVSGTRQSIALTSLRPNTKYDFAIRAIDDVGNISPISNIVNITTGDLPDLGNGLLGSYFSDKNLTNLVLSRTDNTINFNWTNTSPDPSLPKYNFSTRWSGQILIPLSGQYTFYAKTDDGLRLWIGNSLVIDKWISSNTEYKAVLNLTGGQKYNIKMEYFQGWGGSVAQLSWSGPNITKQIIPQSQLFSGESITPTVTIAPTVSPTTIITPTTIPVTSTPTIEPTITPTTVITPTPTSFPATPTPGSGNGVEAYYFKDKTLTTQVLRLTEDNFNLDWGLGSPGSEVPVDNFSARFISYIIAPASGSYTFYISGDDGVRLFVNGSSLVSKWFSSPNEYSKSINLTAGQKYEIRVEFYESTINAKLKVQWSGPGITKQDIPNSLLFTN